jgi:hypothetical protein
MKPIIRLMGIPTIARIERGQKGCSLLATDTPIATAMVVPASAA